MRNLILINFEPYKGVTSFNLLTAYSCTSLGAP